MYQIYLWIGLIILIAISIIELWNPTWINEGFTNLISVGDSPLFAKWMPRRGDVGPNPTEEPEGLIRDIRYVAQYADIQRIGVEHDFCRMVQKKDDPDDMFFACALGGTDGLSSIKYRTPSVKDGFELSRDDYMNDVLQEGRQAYCRILKVGDGRFEAKCNLAGDHSFKDTMVVDSRPPEEIKTLLSFYEGIVFWLRLRDDMLDYAKNLIVMKAGDINIQESPPNPPITEGLTFDGKDQFLRIGDMKNLSFGNVVQLKYLRATCFWVYFEEFTNNAKIFDFGNGPGKDNVFCGIMGRGNAGTQTKELLTEPCLDQAITTVPQAPSGQQCTEEVSPMVAMVTSSANVNRWDCPSPELFGKIMKPLLPAAEPPGEATTADLIYEIWDNKQRKLHLQVKNVIPLRKWVHIAITTTNNDAFKPGLKIYRNGELVLTEAAAWLPQTNETTNNYIGKSNWSSATSPYQNADELFKGKMFDIRGYDMLMTEKKIKDTVQWGKDKLGLTGKKAD
jgi:hypothetical protein